MQNEDEVRKEFMKWYRKFLKKNNLKRENIFGDKKHEYKVMREEVIMFNLDSLFAAFKGGKASK